MNLAIKTNITTSLRAHCILELSKETIELLQLFVPQSTIMTSCTYLIISSVQQGSSYTSTEKQWQHFCTNINIAVFHKIWTYNIRSSFTKQNVLQNNNNGLMMGH